MNITKALETWISYSYQKVWNNSKIATRPLWMICSIPVLLSLIGVWFKINILKSDTPPFLYFFVVVMLSACYGGIKGALISSIVTTLFSFIFLFISETKPDLAWVFRLLQTALYFGQCLFLTGILHWFIRNEERSLAQYNAVLRAKQEIQDREKVHEDFVHMATHELKAPVTVLKAYIQLAEMKIELENGLDEQHPGSKILQFKELVLKMNGQLDRLVTLINDLLESTRIQSGALHYQMKLFNLGGCVRACVEGFKAAQPEAIIECDIRTTQTAVLGDESRIEQVILNLLSNAVKYSPGTPKVLVICEQVGQSIFMRVKDHGLGIPEEMKSLVFDRFFRVKSPEMEKLPGLGLGLYICSEIIKSHNGQIGVESALNYGSTFWFSLPAVNAA